MPSGAQREFFTVSTVAEALAGFQPCARTRREVVALGEAAGRVPAGAVPAPSALPGFPRSTVDGYAVRAQDTYGASEGLPSYLDVIGSVRMGVAPTDEVRTGTAVYIPTGGVLPAGADAVVMIEYTQEAMPGTTEVVRPVAPGEGIVRADEDVATGQDLVRAGRPLRAQDVGLLAAAGVTEVPVHARPRVGILSTGDEVVAPETAELAVGQVRDATSVALAALVREAGGEPVFHGIIADDREALERALTAALADSDVVVISAGSSVGARDETATVVAGLGSIFCHGLALRPGKPTMLADCGGIPLIGLPGNPRSALVVFRLVGMPIIRRAGGWTETPVEPTIRARLQRNLPSAAGRLDVVQATVRDGEAIPLFGSSSLLSILIAADGYLTVPEEATGLAAGTEVDVVLYR
ncbi:MAG: Molybdopterin molybdenumtransferase [uncultured Solirubrobacteraceae bacterium]|uniref:Molybdopterin molybdenumtransferase n=1 Tax=uncultured Solirubrobacteraceae bacterium TaxID=1162706 RepID=A0A6J4RJX3_9ACTN|nr:MAG: Molybdopterin molybdenumtransferase [uncultured Solirubrobacteraceae bacterium]